MHHEAIVEAYAANSQSITLNPIGDTDDVPTIVAEKIYALNGGNWSTLDPAEKKEKANSKKKLLNTQAIERMTIARIQNRGAYNEIKSGLVQIQSFVN